MVRLHSTITTRCSALSFLIVAGLIVLLYHNVFDALVVDNTLIPGRLHFSPQQPEPIRPKTFPKQYIPPHKSNVSKPGTPMNVTSELMTSLGIPLSNLVVINARTVGDFVFVTGASSDHFNESIDAIASVQTHMPGYKIYYYDLGLTENEIELLRMFCNVTYRKLNFGKYPDHVRNLTTYAFKPVIVQDVLTKHPAVVWMDASFRLRRGLFELYQNIVDAGGFLYFSISCCSNFATTNPLMYEYIPTMVEKLKEFPQAEANALYLSRSEAVYKNVVYWWVLCALDPDCISPPGSNLSCRFQGQLMKKYAGCNRYDQSILGLLTANFYGYNLKVYSTFNRKVVQIKRRVTDLYQIQNCQS